VLPSTCDTLGSVVPAVKTLVPGNIGAEASRSAGMTLSGCRDYMLSGNSAKSAWASSPAWRSQWKALL
jgi:hypothetical protein